MQFLHVLGIVLDILGYKTKKTKQKNKTNIKKKSNIPLPMFSCDCLQCMLLLKYRGHAREQKTAQPRQWSNTTVVGAATRCAHTTAMQQAKYSN